MFAEAVDKIVTDLQALNLEAYNDPRAARPFSVFVELPTFDGFNARIADATVTLRVLGSPPGNALTAKWILETVDTIMAAGLGITAGRPTVAIVGEQSIPCYDLTCRISIRREPPPPPPAP